MFKQTKKALMLSVFMLIVCLSMLLGTTYAWFTDSASSGGNVIMAGTLDVDMVDANNNSMEDKIIEFVPADNRAQDSILWEPGCTYSTKPVYIVNNGNLALNYEIIINGIDGNAKLLEVIEWTVTVGDVTTKVEDLKGTLKAGEKTGAIVLTGHMKEDANNDYQGLAAEGISIAVFASQMTLEKDSFGDQYDKDAEYAAQTMLKEVADVAAGDTATVKLESDGYVVITNENPVGAKVVGDVTLDLNGKKLFVKVEDGNAHKSLFNIVKNGKLTVTGDGTIEMLAGKNNLVTAIFNNTGGTLVIKNGTYRMDHLNNWQDALIPTIIDNNNTTNASTVTIDGGNFYHTRNMFRNFSSNSGEAEIIINGGTFNGKADDWAAIWNQKPSASVPEGKGKVTINGGEFNYVEISNEFNTGVTIADGVLMPTPVTTAAELKASLKDGVKAVLLNDIEVDKNETITIANGIVTGIDLNGYEIKSTADKTGNQELFLVKGNMTVSNGSLELTAQNNQGWSSMATIFDVTAGGVLTLKNVTAKVSGTDMNFIVHLNNWGSATLYVDNCDFTATYVAIRAFNSGYDMNTVTVKNTDFHTGRMFWVHNYTSEGKDASTLTLDIYGNGNTTDNAKPVRFGFSTSTYYDIDGNLIP